MHYAHSLESNDKALWQELPDHLQEAGRLAALFAHPFGAEKAARLAGSLHDLGKYSAAFQARLEGATQPVDHATAGAAELLAMASEMPDSWDRIMAELAAYAVAGHHAGLPNGVDLRARVQDLALPLDPVWKNELPLDARGLKPPLRPHSPRRAAFQLGFLGRMLFSCVVDADYKDTERFYDQAKGHFSDRDWPRLQAIIGALISAFDTYMAAKQAGPPPSDVNRLRREILAHLRRKADMAPGLFTLTVPTGGGKTLASLGFALEHAKRHGLERIIYAIPFTSVIEQTAAIFREVLGPDVLLEHHSAIETEHPSRLEQRDKLRLAMEDWAAPIILTTNVQLFESLFANRSSRCRKLHHLADSVIILDEAQTLPLPLLKPCVAAMDELARNYGASLVLCTATQPALDQRHFPPDSGMGLDLAGRELAPDPETLAAGLKRVVLRASGPLSDDQLILALREHPQGLVIVNSRKHALALFQAARRAGLEGLTHLSTRHYAAHRRDILAGVRHALKTQAPCRLIATSLVEAGVDLDFPRVWRAEAGLDQIAQAAGRCNREGSRPADDSIVTIFTAPDDPPPRDIAQLSAAYARMAARHADHFSPAALQEYFREVYWSKGGDLDRHHILDCFAADRTGLEISYRTVAERFRMIDSGLLPVIIPERDDAQKALDLLGWKGVSPGGVAGRLQPFLVLVPPQARARLLASGHVAFQREDLFGDQFAVLRTPSLYQDETGLLWDDAEYLGLEQTIF
ncbi:DEAD/DEAH box helicase [mine drainage metagenome]|uniref:DEAD/DEAH box helicase n=1 Tax=mine drainage metagenome TaxID=410659 RepID=A0A1J5S1I9_9ZZZZ